MWVGHDHSSQGIEDQGHRSRSGSRVRLMRSVSVRPWSRALFPSWKMKSKLLTLLNRGLLGWKCVLADALPRTLWRAYSASKIIWGPSPDPGHARVREEANGRQEEKGLAPKKMKLGAHEMTADTQRGYALQRWSSKNICGLSVQHKHKINCHRQKSTSNHIAAYYDNYQQIIY